MRAMSLLWSTIRCATIGTGLGHWGWSLGIVREGEDADLHIGGALRPLIQPLFQGELTARWNVGQPDAALRQVDPYAGWELVGLWTCVSSCTDSGEVEHVA